MAGDDEAAADERAARRDRKRLAARERIQKHGAATARVYRDAVLKRMRKNAGTDGRRGKRNRR
ncbi:MAG TPA: hypothetical protein VNM91_06490 [Dehalococcoidia bacterium]|nr:hypothetical protein [Dehalococcoidia bacterium]